MHAFLTERLLDAGAAQIAFDVDFSSRSTPEDDAAFEVALRRADGRVILPGFIQSRDASSHRDEFLSTVPLPRLAEHSTLASVNMLPDSDGVLRRSSWREPLGNSDVPTLGALLSGRPVGPTGERYFIDFSIRLQDIPTISYADVLAGEYDPAVFAGRSVVVGASAVELGDILPVPVWDALPGVMVQALVAESFAQNRTLTPLPPAIVLAGILLIAFTRYFYSTGRGWKIDLCVAFGFPVVLYGVSVAAQALFPVVLDTIPWSLTAVLCFVTGLARQIDRQNLRILAQTLALIRTEKLMRGVVEHSFDGILTVDVDSRVTSLNRAAEAILGRSRQDAENRPVTDLLNLPDKAHHGNGDPINFIAGLAAGGTPEEIEVGRPDGRRLHLDLAVSVLDDKNNFLYILLIRDVTAKKEAEARAAEAQQQLMDGIASISEGFVLWGPDDELIMCNEKFRRLVGPVGKLMEPGTQYVEFLSALAETHICLVPGQSAGEWFAEAAAQRGGETAPYEFETRDGVWVRVSERRASDGCMVGILTDITDDRLQKTDLIRAKDAAEEASLAKSQFLAAMSHELRTPLNAILGFSEIIKSQALGPVGTEDYATYASDIYDSGSHLLSVINDILDIAKIESGNVELSEDKFRLNDVLEACLRMNRAKAEKGNLTVELAPDSWAIVLQGDQRLVKQSVLNLLSNAVKFTPSGGKISIQIGCDAAGDAFLKVADTGVGIAPEEISAVIEPFRQVEADLNRKYEGTGLGLPLTKGFLELHGGDLEIESELGQGTSVTLRYPKNRICSAEKPPALPLAS